MNEGLLIGGMALVTFLIRYSLLALSGRLNLAPATMKALSFVPPVVLTAIVVPAVLMPDGKTLWLGWGNARLVGAVACVALGFWRGNLLLTIVGGMAVFWGWQWLIHQS
jgi:branched-subunit amino acid transport protein